MAEDLREWGKTTSPEDWREAMKDPAKRKQWEAIMDKSLREASIQAHARIAAQKKEDEEREAGMVVASSAEFFIAPKKGTYVFPSGRIDRYESAFQYETHEERRGAVMNLNKGEKVVKVLLTNGDTDYRRPARLYDHLRGAEKCLRKLFLVTDDPPKVERVSSYGTYTAEGAFPNNRFATMY